MRLKSRLLLSGLLLVAVPNDRPGRLHKALEILRKVHGDVAREEDDPMTRGLRDRAARFSGSLWTRRKVARSA